MREAHRWTQEEVTTLVTLLRQEGGVTVGEAAEALGLTREQVSAKATEARKRLEPDISVPKFKRVTGEKVAAWWDEVKERVGGGGVSRALTTTPSPTPDQPFRERDLGWGRGST